MRESSGHMRANGRRMLADPSGERQYVDAPGGRGHRADRRDQPVHEHLKGQAGVRICSRSTLFHLAHVAGASQREQTRPVLERLGDLPGREPRMFLEPQHQAGIQSPRTCGHH